MSIRQSYGSNDSGILKDPFFKELNVLFKNMLHNQAEFVPFGSAMKLPYPMNTWYNDEFFVIEIPILKGKLEDIEITKSVDLLRVKYQNSNREELEKKWISRGIVERDFDHAWRLSAKLDHTGIQSVFENGLLTIYVPFAKAAKPEKVQILDTGANWKKIATGDSLVETTESL